jgi:hypothetical protein
MEATETVLYILIPFRHPKSSPEASPEASDEASDIYDQPGGLKIYDCQ